MTTYGDEAPGVRHGASGRAAVPGAVAPTAPPPAVGRASVPDEAGQQRPRRRKGRGRRRRTRLAVIIAVVLLLTGGGLIGGTWFYDSVPRPDQLSLKENTEVWSSDGKQLAKLGAENRTLVVMGTLPRQVRDALIAGEDKNFYDHDGIDPWGIARAAWNNLTGGTTQGASTITQQYARAAADDMEITFARKLREAVMARKLEKEYSKEQIMGFYLNTVYFGRSAYGVGAAARAYFGVDATKLTVAQAAVLGAVLRQPEPNSAHQGYDPQNNLAEAKRRWGYVLDNMVEMRWLSAADRAAQVYPEKELKPYKPGQYAGEWGYVGSGTGHVVHHVGDELRAWGISDWRSAGYRITTTIDSRAQAALQQQVYRSHEWRRVCKTADGKQTCTEELVRAVDGKGTLLSGQPKNLMAAAVAIEPSSGRVLAYYGGNDGTGTDYAGVNAAGTDSEFGGHPPASSFKIYTLAAALEHQYSIKSRWDSTELKKSRGDEFDVSNSGRENASCNRDCPLDLMTIKSYNVPFFKIAKAIGPEEVVGLARRAGIGTMWSTGDGKARHLDDPRADTGRGAFYYQVGFGQYPITVLDHATGVATFAAGGVYHKPHFVVKVERKNRKTGAWETVPGTGEQLVARRAFTKEIADEVTGVLKQIVGSHALSGRQAAAKTGTWENGQRDAKGRKRHEGENAHAWFVGYTPQIATAVWVGNVRDELPIRDRNGRPIGGSKLPGDIWEGFMNAAHKAMKLPPQPLPDGTGGDIGSKDAGDGVPEPTPTPTAPPATPPCDPATCPSPTPTASGSASPRP
ncbi:transglycosylase domain-containing protein [Catellatospora sp. KI3]|uniref:transglycosylase domain-containing protein n=1 Tax=Catellatospora sp. KI3 TaxID=3041620 RepID=UPI002482D78D|nr:transglycosylase domain-containing protein [Catellatospora sp. KI3]MDI1465997.1 transglycosylase domain-containing protein [Catellatospora sp. KI3]